MVKLSSKALLASSNFIATSLQHAPYTNSTTGFLDPKFSSYATGFADCISGLINVPATTHSNVKLLFTEPANQYEVTASFVHFLQANSSQAAEMAGGPSTINSTVSINAKLCYPKHTPPSSTLQFLIHGIGFNQSYWDFATNYSFIDVAAQNGYPTFSYDRLGVGGSSHPDPIQIVQAPLQVEIAHSLISFLRSGKISGHAFKNIVGVGHSFGSIQGVSLLAKYPTDLDAVALTGFLTNTSALETTFAYINSAIAAETQPDRFGTLDKGYLVVDNAIGNQFAFFYYPNFDPDIFLLDNAWKQTYTYGEIFTLLNVVAPSAFTGPVDAMVGEFDWIFTKGNAYYPTDAAALVQPILFPNASAGSQSYVVPGAGHAINLHYAAGAMFEQVQGFVKSNGFWNES